MASPRRLDRAQAFVGRHVSDGTSHSRQVRRIATLMLTIERKEATLLALQARPKAATPSPPRTSPAKHEAPEAAKDTRERRVPTQGRGFRVPRTRPTQLSHRDACADPVPPAAASNHSDLQDKIKEWRRVCAQAFSELLRVAQGRTPQLSPVQLMQDMHGTRPDVGSIHLCVIC